ncbi:hypothetical protein A5806_000762 [Enterococcus faecium]|uniref:hypothetical protein n=1 Tax=Enterococcus faecium TaxID=1352 RepID=UPI000B3E455E|nr:hypothetical protein [Enterococcus faecium]OUZ31481.1 hypothetical protein A5806_000762 [Enterococcus faecium]
MVMRKIRSSITGTEYWDSEKKKTVVVPKGQEPDFDEDEAINDKSAEEKDELDNMTAKELRAYAKKHSIDIPGAIRAKGDILKFIRESE